MICKCMDLIMAAFYLIISKNLQPLIYDLAKKHVVYEVIFLCNASPFIITISFGHFHKYFMCDPNSCFLFSQFLFLVMKYQFQYRIGIIKKYQPNIFQESCLQFNTTPNFIHVRYKGYKGNRSIEVSLICFSCMSVLAQLCFTLKQ